MIRQYFRIMIRSKTTITVMIALILYTLIPVVNVNLLVSTAWERNPSFFNANYASFFFIYGATFFTVPLFFIFLQQNRAFFEKDCVIVRFADCRRYWKIRTLVTALESAAYVLFIYFLIFLRSVYFKQSAGFLKGILFLLKAALSQTTMLFLLALLFCFISYLTNQTVLAFACAYFFVVNDYTVLQTGRGVELFALKAIAVTPESMNDYWFNLILVILIVALFFVFSLLVVDSSKDHLQKRVL